MNALESIENRQRLRRKMEEMRLAVLRALIGDRPLRVLQSQFALGHAGDLFAALAGQEQELEDRMKGPGQLVRALPERGNFLFRQHPIPRLQRLRAAQADRGILFDNAALKRPREQRPQGGKQQPGDLF